MKILAFLGESVSELGIANGLLATLARSIDRISDGRCRLFKYYFVAQPVPPGPSKTADSSTTRIYRVSPEDGIIRQFPRPPQNILKRFADGAVCHVAEQTGKFAGFIWIKQERYFEDEVRCHYVLSPPTLLTWDFDAYVAPEFRMSRVFVRLWAGVNDYLREHGYRWTISRISAFNAASLASHKRFGLVRLHTGFFIVLGQCQVSVFTCRPYLHIGASPSDSPEIVFHAPDGSTGGQA